MAQTSKHLRSSTADKRPTTAIAEGQLALNTNATSPGLYFKDSTGATIIKVGPVHVGTTAPNVAPPTGGSSGNSTGEVWLDTSLTPAGVKIWNGSAWVNATPSGSTTVQGLLELATDAETQAGADTARAVSPASLQSKLSDSTSTTSSTTIASSTAVKAAYDLANAALPKTGGTVTGTLEIGTTGSLTFEGSTADEYETTLTIADPTADRTITLPNVSGTVVTTGDTGSVTNTMLSGSIANNKLSNSSITVNSASTALGGSVTLYAGTTTLQTSSANQGLTGISSIALPGATSGTITVTPAATAGTTSITVPATSGTLVTTGDTGTVTSAMLANGTIVNEDVNASAAIAGTKISPDFGAQNVTTTGTSTAASFIPSSATVPTNGVYLPAANSVGISTNAVQRIAIDSSGNVKLGSAAASGFRLSADGDAWFGNGSGVEIGRLFNDSGTLCLRASSNVTGLGLATNSSSSHAVRITSAGLVGIGTSAPTQPLEIGGSGNIKVAGGGTFFSGGDLFIRAGASGALRLGSNDANDRVYLDTSGRLGIGTTSPLNKFVVSNGGAAGLEMAPDGFSGNPVIVSYNRSGTAYTQLTLDGASNVFAISGTERARIDSSGRLLVGTSSAHSDYIGADSGFAGIASFVRNAGDGVAQFQNWTNSTGLDTVGGTSVFISRCKSGTVGTHTGGALASGNPIGRIVFNASDGTSFRSSAYITAEVDGAVSTADVPGRLVFSTTASGASSPTERMRITQAGNTLIGSASQISSERLGITFAEGNQGIALNVASGAAQTQILFANPNGTVGTISTSGSATAYNTSSDYRLKENVTAVTDGIARLQQLKPSRFNFIADPDKTVDGFIAHEVQAVVPEAITGEKDAVDDDGNPIYQGIDQSKLVPLLTAALQEAVAKIESLEARLTAAGI